MSYLLIRHDEKKYANGMCGLKEPKFDPPLLDTRPRLNEFKSERSRVSEIIVSPMLRCRQTSESRFPGIEYKVNVLLTEYLGNQKDLFKLDQRPEFLKLNFHELTYEYLRGFQFENNTKDFYLRMIRARKSLPTPDDGMTVVVVTHGLCLEYLFDIFKKEGHQSILLRKHPKEGFTVNLNLFR